ncbi:hypothetical protein C900_02866 [Fulvivirga imtechensis AK7]|uniref:Uncharacterized protein n=1 Tax=Fulvivirga imtechensis AK7 TaxID=1237149 RepID=L8JQN5_9BACT|nr:hypothetical protein [Fulvivirga imtechensis]ELR71251.1 hypothetical protein C900_02866 [Fulvivirga imtechensis AK7]
MKLLLLFPATYFVKTRLNTLKALIFHPYFEWVPVIMIMLLWKGFSITETATNFLLCYGAFISIYEIGYFANDLFPSRFEKNHRKRTSDIQFRSWYTVFFVLSRIGWFLFFTFYGGFNAIYEWWYFYALLVVVFSMHNLLPTPSYKWITFLSLSLMRFTAPVFIFLEDEFFIRLIVAAVLNYSLFRLVIYMESKNILTIPNRRSSSFAFYFYLTIVPVNFFVAIIANDMLPLSFCIYYLLFCAFNFLLSKARFSL